MTTDETRDRRTGAGERPGIPERSEGEDSSLQSNSAPKAREPQNSSGNGSGDSPELTRRAKKSLAELLLASHFPFLLELHRVLRQRGISYTHYSLLGCIQRQPLIMREIAARLDITVAGATGVVDSLEERQLVARRQCRSDRRRTIVAITPEGTAVIDEIREATQGLVAKALIDEVREATRELVAKALMAEASGQDEEFSDICQILKQLVRDEMHLD